VCIGFGRVEGYRAPPWTADAPPRIRIDVAADDLPDPEGHPFCVTAVI
jgi:hypothetical protein